MSFNDRFKIIEEKYAAMEWAKRRDKLKIELLSRPIVLYGLGFFGAVIVRSFREENMKVECFCDSNKKGIDRETGLKIISPEELKEKYSDANVVVSVANPSTEQAVYNTIVSLGFKQDQIFHFEDAYQFIRKSRVEQVALSLEEFREYIDGYERAYNLFEDEISKNIVIETINNYLFHSLFEYDPPEESYFPKELVFNNREVFIDGGLYTGDTTEEFIKRMNGEYARIIGFDIDENNLTVARKNLSNFDNVEIMPKGLWDKEAVMNAELGIMAGSNVNEDAENQVQLVCLDDIFANIQEEGYPTFIKLDIEGSEKEALLGAKEIIGKNKPKLAICVYHKPEDMYLIPELIKKLNPEYKLFMRHYSPYIWDTVLYAY